MGRDLVLATQLHRLPETYAADPPWQRAGRTGAPRLRIVTITITYGPRATGEA
ncbi:MULTISPECIES: hypothetical protein [Burkholderia]|uniref:Uncharacterized protein n=1 Tax=Burkholderia anthinoferrum TaxID=3090833 RepID=A0ABU5WGM6_9BURK|nr:MULTISPECIES: hypothetical protein [Burkholderia]MEB2560247.1 hypothetical protein [Burkholderia anthinoferrum]MEB2577453.1 hypothetical protein [Burkholderia anthinoferrum]WJN78886.1 hypothetical protein OH687_33880 [Burkholderia anthina]